MNDKKQLAAMDEHLAEQQPLCMAKRIEELEAQVRVMVGLLREAQECVVHDVVRGMDRNVESLWARIDAACGDAAAGSGKRRATAWIRVGAAARRVHPRREQRRAGVGRHACGA